MGKRRERDRPRPVGDVLAGWLSDTGLARRVAQAGVVPEWPALVGPQIASVTSPVFVTGEGTLFVQVSTNSWMTELSMMEPELLKILNEGAERPPIRRIRWLLRG